MSPQQIATLVVAGTIGLLLLLLVVYGRPRRSRQEPTPSNFSRGDPDSVLEGSRLQKMQVWGLASAVFVAGFLALYLVVEPFREARYTGAFLERSVVRGEEVFLEGAACANCHGPDLTGGFASSNTKWPAPPLNNVLARYTRDQVMEIIERGRPGTPMPPWAVEFGGPLNFQKIDDVLNYVESKQLEKDKHFELPATLTDGRQIYEQKCASCHGDDATGRPMGRGLPTFVAPDLTTEFHRLGLGVMRERLARQIFIEKDGEDATTEEIETRLEQTPFDVILDAGKDAALKTIEDGRTNTPMPSWENRITEKQIEAVLSYIQSIQKPIQRSAR